MKNEKSENDYQIGIMKKKCHYDRKKVRKEYQNVRVLVIGSERGKKAGQLYLKSKEGRIDV